MKTARTLEGICIPEGTMDLIFQSRVSWRDLTTLLKFYMDSKHADTQDRSLIRVKITELLIRNVGIFNNIFGPEAVEEFVQLSFGFVNYMDLVLDAQIAGNWKRMEFYEQELQDNAQRMATFLATVNPYWEELVWEELFQEYNQNLIQQSETILQGNFSENINTFSKELNLATIIGDYYSQGLLDYLVYSSRMTR